VEKSSLTQATILHHDEADGLTSAALTKLSLEHLGLKTELICLDKLYPEVIADVQARQGQLIVYVDMGSAHIDWLSKYNRTGNLIVTLDHHDTSETKDPLLVNLNPELDGFSGEKEASSATVAYMFAKAVD
jgi:RecJ-like exonuclease